MNNHQFKRNLVGAFLSAIVLASSVTNSFADVRDGLLSYWPLDVDSGDGTTPDVAPTGNKMNIVNGSTITNGEFGNAFFFSVSGSISKYLTLLHSANSTATGLPIYSAPAGYSVTFWVKSGAATAHYLFTESSSTNNNPLFLIQTGNAAGVNTKLDIAVRNDAGTFTLNHVASTNTVFNSAWHHIAWVDNHGAAKLYIDGALDPANYNYTPSGTITLDTTSVAQLVRAATSASAGLTGAMDDIAVWERTLSQAEIQSIMSNSIPTPISPAAPVFYRSPAPATNAMGDRATFTAGAAGTHPLYYQWYQDTNLLANQTNNTLILTSLTNTGMFNYSVVASNAIGMATNSTTLTVLPDSAPNLASNLVSYWPLDTVTNSPNTNTPDIYYQHDNFVLTGMDTNSLVTGEFNEGLQFNGFTQYGLRSGGSPIYKTTNYTISFWLNGSPGQLNKQIFSEADPSGSFFLLGTENDAAPTGCLNVKSSVASTGLTDRKSTRTVLDGTWHHVVWVDENGNGKLYVDGVLDETDYTYVRTNLTLSTTCIGALFRSSAANFFAGALDEVAVWSRRLSFTEIQQIQTNTVPQPALAVPVITQQPVGSTNAEGDHVTLSAIVTGSAPITYQWFLNGGPVNGGTNSALVLQSNIGITNQYFVAVTNPAIGTNSVTVTVAFTADPAPNVSSNLLYYWPLDTVTTNGTSPDVFGGDDLALTGMDTNSLVPGEFNEALFFNGAGQFGQRSNGGYPAYLTTNYSISFWVNASPGQANRMVYAEGGAGGNFFLLGTENSAPFGGSLNVKISPGMNDRKSTSTVFDNTWHHVVWTDANGRGKLYVDGVEDQTDYTYTRTNAILETSAIAALVRATPSLFLAGEIDDVAVWSRVITFTEINQIQSSGMPASITPAAPFIFRQPLVNTNLIFAGDSVNVSVLASGSGPLKYQWLKNGNPMDGVANPTALTGTLILANVTTNDTAAYSVQISNSVNLAVSSGAPLTVIPYVKVTNGLVIRLDFDATNSPDLQPGFSEMTLLTPNTNFGGVTVAISSLGGAALSDRDRATSGGGFIANNPPLLTQAQLYNDFIFANDTTNSTGLRILITRLAANTQYGLTIWSYDIGSLGARFSDWNETSSGTPIPITTPYSFDGSVPPTTDYDETFGALLTSSPNGALQIDGVKDGASGANLSVFLNALQLVANPTIQISNVSTNNGNIQMLVQTQYPSQPIIFQESPDLSAGSWQNANDGAYTTHGPYVTAVFPMSTNQMFYRVMKQ